MTKMKMKKTIILKESEKREKLTQKGSIIA